MLRSHGSWLVALLFAVLLPVLATPAHAQDRLLLHTKSDPDRVSVEASLGATFGVLGMVGGGIAGYLVDRDSSGPCIDGRCPSGAEGLLLGAYAGGLLLLPMGVTLGGHAMEGMGDLYGAYLGELVGAAVSSLPVGLLLWAAAQPGTSDADATGYVAGALACALLFPLGGAIVGYEMTDAEASDYVAVSPMVSVSPDGAVLGVSGAF